MRLVLAINLPSLASELFLTTMAEWTTPTLESASAALKRLLLSIITPAMAAETEGMASIRERIHACMERVKVEASEGAALVAECAPHGRVMVAQAQKTLADLEALAVMEILVAERNGAQRGV